MYTNVSSFSRQSYRDHHKRRNVTPRVQSFHEHSSTVHERAYTIKLRRRRAQAALSFYDNNADDEDEPIVSKWTIVRQRLPDILALSNTYRPMSVRAKLVLLITLMNQQTIEDLKTAPQLNSNEYNSTISRIIPNNVIVDINGRSRIIRLKRIPSEQVIHVDIDSLSFSIPTRQFILAISRGYAHETAVKYCPPAISDMLIELSKTKVADDRLKYKRAQLKMRLGQILFVAIFTAIICMMFALIISATKTIMGSSKFAPD